MVSVPARFAFEKPKSELPPVRLQRRLLIRVRHPQLQLCSPVSKGWIVCRGLVEQSGQCHDLWGLQLTEKLRHQHLIQYWAVLEGVHSVVAGRGGLEPHCHHGQFMAIGHRNVFEIEHLCERVSRMGERVCRIYYIMDTLCGMPGNPASRILVLWSLHHFQEVL